LDPFRLSRASNASTRANQKNKKQTRKERGVARKISAEQAKKGAGAQVTC
jgi:hypothetical protein